MISKNFILMAIVINIIVIAEARSSEYKSDDKIQNAAFSICTNANIDCSNITSYNFKTLVGIEGKSILYSNGEVDILIDSKYKTKPTVDLSAVLIHEIAHALEFSNKNYSHNSEFSSTCYKIALANGRTRAFAKNNCNGYH